jgi:hypothetical protein
VKDGKAALSAAKRGDTKGFVKHSMGLGWTMVQLQFFASLAATVLNVSQGRDSEGEEAPPMFTGAWERSVVTTTFDNFLTPWIIPKAIINSVPVLRDIMFNQSLRDKTNNKFVTVIAPMDVAAINKLSAGVYSLSNLISQGDLSVKETKALVEGAGTIGPVPIGLINKHIVGQDGVPSWLDSVRRDPGMLISLPVLAYELMSKSLSTNNTEVYNQAAEVKKMLDPHSATEMNAVSTGQSKVINDYYENVIMFTESGGDPNAKTEGSEASGLFKITPGAWNDLMTDHPELGLTKAGRSDPDQQKIAFKKMTQLNGKTLIQNKIPVTVENVYTMHHFDDNTSLRILKMNDDQKLPPMASDRKVNPWLNGGDSDINSGKKVETVGDFKKGISDLLQRGEKLYLESLD